MKYQENGFTLVELCACIILFGIFLECILGFYTHVYLNYMHLRQQLSLASEGNDIEIFIKDCIREAEQVKVVVDGAEIENVTDINDIHNQDVIDQDLHKIEFTRKIKRGTGYEEQKCSIEMVNMDEYKKEKGKCKLVYKVDEKATSNTISDQIENIKVTSYKHSNIVEFKCLLKKKDETHLRCTYTKVFSESLAYKGHCA